MGECRKCGEQGRFDNLMKHVENKYNQHLRDFNTPLPEEKKEDIDSNIGS